MTWVDWAIVIVLFCSTVGGLMQGFFRTACSLIGLLAGLSLAAWNYHRVAHILLPVVRIEAVANAIAFFLIAILVGALAGLIGSLLGRVFEWIGLGCLDKIGGAFVGFWQGTVLVILAIIVTIAFFPQAQWLRTSTLAPQFLAACRISTHISPEELAQKIRSGLQSMEKDSPRWMHPEK